MKRVAKKGAIFLLAIFFWDFPASAQSSPGYGKDTEGKPRLVLIKPSAPPRMDIPAIAKAADGAIVTIVMANNDKPIASGTGFLVNPDGVIVTNYHVIATGNAAAVKFPDGTVLPVDGVLAADKVRDLAVVKIHGKTFRTLTLGNSDRIQVGEAVVAIGNPLSLESTVSNGIVSGVRTAEKFGGKFLQTTAPISPGSSGGPLFNMAGEVVGITTLYLKGGENLNFAIPVNDAKLLLQKQSAVLQGLPNEPEPVAPPVAKAEPPKEVEKIWSADVLGGEYKIEAETSEIRITTIRAPSKAICDVYHISQEGFAHDIILDIKDVNGHLVGPLDADGQYMKEGKSWVRKTEALELYAVSDSKLAGWIFVTDSTGSAQTVPIMFTAKETHAVLATPTNTPNNPLPPSTKVAATPIGSTQPATIEQLQEDMTYCYQHPSNNLQTSSGALVGCAEVNETRTGNETQCKTNPEARPGCRDFLKFVEDLKAGRL
jgi:hypothetical protein